MILAALLFASLFAALAPPADATLANGTIKVLKGGDRNAADHSSAGYAVGLAGAVFEYSTSSTFSSIAGTFPATDATGAATVSVAPNTYYVREKTAPSGWTDMGAVQSLYFDPSSSTPDSARSYLSTVEVSSGKTTTTYPNRSSGSVQEEGDSGSPFVDIRDNATFPSYCGTKIQLVLDRSGSISPYKDDYKTAVDAFIDALNNTPTQIGITSFNTDVNTDGISAQSPLSLSTAGNAATLKSRVADVYDDPQSGTNWDAALRDAAGRTGFAPTPESASAKPDIVVFITDGNPTVSPTDSDSGDVSLLDLTYGMASANLVKNQVVAGSVKMKMFALGVGDGVTVENLKVVSGPNDDLNADPDYAATSILALTNKLKEIAGRSCGARIIVRKKLVGAGDDTTARSNWNFAANSGASVSYSDPDNAAPYKTSGSPAQMTISVNAIPAGGTNVTVTEDAAGQPLPATDYGLTGVVCETGQFGSGNTRSTTSVDRGFSIGGVLLKRNTDLFCTFTNSVLQPNVTLTKTTSTPTVNAGDVAKFSVKIENTGQGTATNVVVSDQLPAGLTWTADGALPAGCVLAAQKVTCTLATLAKNASVTFSVKATTSAAQCATYDNTVSATAGNQATIVNDTESVTCLKPPKLTVIKHVVNSSGGTKLAGDFSLSVDDAGNDPPAAVTGAETPGTTLPVAAGTYSVTEPSHAGYTVGYSADCNATIAFGQTKACTVTNDDIAPTVKVVKVVVNNNGGAAVPADWQLHLKSGVTDVTGSPKSGKTAGDTYTVSQGAYTVSETGGPAGYAATYSGDCNTGGAISVTVGQDKTCTITNDDIGASVKVRKVVVNDSGGTALPADWQLHLKSGANEVAGSPKAGKTLGDTYGVSPGSYVVSETGGPSGYAATFSDDCTQNGTIGVALGQDRICTITNNDTAPTIKVRKVVVNDNGGTAVAADWQLHLKSGANEVSGSPKTGKTLGDTYIVAQGAYAVSETGGPAGYAATFSEDCNSSGAITVALAQDRICTITNDDIGASVKVRKVVVNDSGGTATPADWQLHLKSGGDEVAGSPKAGKTLGDTYAVTPGSYAVSETGGPSGYAATFSGDCGENGTISVALGQDKICTITNNDIAPTIKVRKVVVNDNGGTAAPADWQLHLKGGGDDVSGSPKSGKTAGDTYSVSQGAYTVSETGGPAGYAATFSGDCTAGGAISVTVGQDETCTITNDDVAPTLTVVKHVVNKNGSTATASDFAMHITGTAGSPPQFDGLEAGVTKTLAAGTYAVTETGAASSDYSQTDSADCSGALAVGDAKTCTITNTRKTGTITVVKDLIPASDDGRFDLTVDSTVVKQDAADGGSGSLEVNTGTHTVSEAAGSVGSLGNYAKGISCNTDEGGQVAGPVQVRVSSGAQIICTITNRRVLAQPVVVKAGDTFTYHGDTVSYTFAVSNTGNSPLHDVHVTDDKCPKVSSAPTSKSNDNGDAVLDPIGANGTSAEVWVFTCSYQMADHQAGEANPVVNTATVTAVDELDRPVTDLDQHSTTLLHPAIALTKTGPASATAGDRVVYMISANNTGDVAFPAALVVITDARCEAPPMLISTAPDTSSGTLDPGDTWRYACAVQTASGQTSVHNVAVVDGTDINGRHATGQATADTLLTQPAAAVLASGDPIVAPASAKLRGPTGCMPRTAKIVVTGSRIAQVTFTLDGKRKKTVKPAAGASRVAYSVAKSKLRSGTHRVKARVVYQPGSSATAKTLVMTLIKCRPAAVKPAFAG